MIYASLLQLRRYPWEIVSAGPGTGLFKSTDGGATWVRTNEDANLTQRPWYHHHIIADPKVASTVYVLNVDFWKSTDGGATFTEIAVPHGDNHDLWIDPGNPLRMVEANDGGATVSINGGTSWTTIMNQPTAQLYHVAVDNRSGWCSTAPVRGRT